MGEVTSTEQIEELVLELVRTRAERDYWRSELKADRSAEKGELIAAEARARELELENGHLRLAMEVVRKRFQTRVSEWVKICFGEEIAADTIERNHRFLEEALELVQSLGCTQAEAHQLVDYVYGRPVGEPEQEVGGVMVTLAALCSANCLDMEKDGEAELHRVWGKVDQIRAKQAAKPKHSPLPGSSPDEDAGFDLMAVIKSWG